MSTLSFLLLVLILTLSMITDSRAENSPLSGKHLRVFPHAFPASIHLERNQSGHIIQASGALIEHISALSKMFNFSFHYTLSNASLLDDSPSGKGMISHLINDEFDYLLSSGVGTVSRFQKVDLPTYWYHGDFSAMVNYPTEQIDITASLKPLSYQVWILIVATALATFLYLRFYGQNRQFTIKKLRNNRSQYKLTTTNRSWSFNFVIGNLVSQGQSCPSSSLTVRFAAGAWCLTCFFLVQIYCTTLTSHLTATNQKPIADSVQELAGHPNGKLSLDRGFAADILIQSTGLGAFKRFTEILREKPYYRCNKTSDCLELVRADTTTAYVAPSNNAKILLDNDIKSSGICRFYIMRETFFSSPIFTMLKKNSPFTESISVGIIRLKQGGFYDEWASWFVPQPRQCMKLDRKNEKRDLRLSIRHLSSAFVILMTGSVLSMIIMVLEIMAYKCNSFLSPKS